MENEISLKTNLEGNDDQRARRKTKRAAGGAVENIATYEASPKEGAKGNEVKGPEWSERTGRGKIARRRGGGAD